jgi:hypothetical protein
MLDEKTSHLQISILTRVQQSRPIILQREKGVFEQQCFISYDILGIDIGFRFEKSLHTFEMIASDC